jgi:excinuclease ABC subunit C
MENIEYVDTALNRKSQRFPMSIYEQLKARTPSLPGCYLFKDGAGKILYVGKAKNIKKRVASYFIGKDASPKTQLLVSKITDAEFIVTNTEVEALILENTLIKRHQPPYNIDLKANVRYAYIAITDEAWPRIITVRARSAKGKIYGPFTDGWLRVQLIKLVIDIYKLRICRTLPKKPCLQKHIGKCDAPCIGGITNAAYNANVRKAMRLLDGKTDELAAELEAQMHAFAKAREYEKAKERRDQLALVLRIGERQAVETQRAFDQDVFATVRDNERLKVVAFQIKQGVIAKRERFTIDAVGETPVSDFLRAYYMTHAIPKEIILRDEQEDADALQAYFSKQSGRAVELVVPKRGERKALLDMAHQNAAVDFQEDYPELAELARVLKLKALPRVIECFDISNLGTTDVVAASIRYTDGVPDPAEFRKYAIRTVDGQDDFRSMFEAVGRRYARLKAEEKPMPDLVVIDGGKQQLAFARAALRDAGVSVPIIALAKRDEEIFLPYLSIPVRLPKNNPALKLLQRIRDSTHRFVLSYQRQKRGKRMVS